MINVSQLIGQPVVSLGDAERHGAVTGIRFSGNRVSSLDVGDRSIPIAAVRTLEGDAITFERAGTDFEPVPPRDDDDGDPQDPDADNGEVAGERIPPSPTEAPTWSGDPIGKLLLSTGGNALGSVAEMLVDGDGTVTEITDQAGHSMAGDCLVAVGSYAAIVTEEATVADSE
jgi:hypothetical protein